MNTMKAVGYQSCLPITDAKALEDIVVDVPVATGRDLLVKVSAIAVNPVDFKIRQNVAPELGQHKVIGWDAVGEVVAAGELAKGFKPGDLVYYAGDLNRQGSNAEYQLVDERLVGNKPKSLTSAEAAALPLTSITAWELLFEHFAIAEQNDESLSANELATAPVVLIIGAAGGVGSMLIQLIKTLTHAKVVATASRESSAAWVKELGADYVINHRQPLAEQLQTLGIEQVTHIASLTNTQDYFGQYPEILAPFGKVALIDDPEKPLDIMKLKPKSQSLHIEFMFARSMFNAKDIAKQSQLLNRVSDLIEQGKIKTTVGKHIGIINAENLVRAHAELESGTAIGKLVLAGF
ncbi:zinc-binding alcohol dehydrogenase family protein [Endozoicomonas sp. G2_1]|uniref:zinc-binding alcohol dehydrogenase family protein n=1 Tax=Endozoicomonas sp. G2_1 TaxID=2821091 RepID=UPI0032AEBFDE